MKQTLRELAHQVQSSSNMLIILLRIVASFTIPSFFLAAGCTRSDSPSGSTSAACCDTSASPIFLQSKLDDDDGDGNPFDEDYPTINDEDDDIHDHTWILDDNGTYHLFFHNEGLVSGCDIEHYTSSDLKNLSYVGIALRNNPGGWDSYALWAPHVIKHGNTYFMFYTGTTGPGGDPFAKQRIGLAISHDLITWTRFPANHCPGTTGDGCIYECKECWTTWGEEPGSYNQQCRDPFVIWDPDSRSWLMFATAKSTNQFGVVTVASSANLIHWTGEGFIDATRRLASGTGAQTTGGQAENPHIMSYGGTHYLLFSDWHDPEDSVSVPNPRTFVQYATSSTLAADSSGSINWTYRGYTPDPGVNAIEVLSLRGNIWIMSQSIANERSGSYDHRRHLRLKCVMWGNHFAFDTWNLRLPCWITGPAINPMSVEASMRTPEVTDP
jgi:beta-fructofuranosidase